MRRHPKVYRLVIDSLMAASYFLLAYFHIPLGPYVISLAVLPLLVVAVLFPLPDSLLIVLLGEFLKQALSEYGLTITTPLWMLPPLLRTLAISIVSFVYQHRHDAIENHPVSYFLSVVIGSLLTSAGNTLVMYLDAKIIGYPYSFVLVTVILRFVLTMLVSVLSALLLFPLLKRLRKIKEGQ